MYSVTTYLVHCNTKKQPMQNNKKERKPTYFIQFDVPQQWQAVSDLTLHAVESLWPGRNVLHIVLTLPTLG